MKLLVFFTAVPLAAAFFNALVWRWSRKLVYAFSVAGCAILFALSLYCAKLVLVSGTISYKLGGWAYPLGINLAADGFSVLMLVVINLIGLLAIIYALGYVGAYTGKWKFFTLFMLMLSGLNGVVITQDIFNLYVFLEVASISGYALVAFGIEPQDLEAAFKYLIMGAVASIFVLLGIGLLYSYTSTLNMPDIAAVLAAKPKGALVTLVSVLFFTGFGLKAAIVPFHAWLADAHSTAPSPVSAVLSGVVIKTLGIYALCRVFFNVLGLSTSVLNMLVNLGLLSMLTGGLLAIAQDDIKRMLAYSSVSQIGYIVFALGIGTPLAIFAALFHLFNHAAAKSLLFLNAGAIEQATGTRLLNRLGGLSRKMPVVSGTSLIGALSISGIPPLAGFFSKLLIIIAAAQAGRFAAASVAVAVSILTLAYYLRFQAMAFQGEPKEDLPVRATPAVFVFCAVILALICLFSGLLLLPALKPFLSGAANALLAGNIR